ncbi:hypothetical protein [Streptomyces youssoufiensis]
MTRAYATDEQYERWYMTECCRCGRRRHKAGTWPDGYVCRTCSDRAVRTRGTCPGCGQGRALPGLRPGDGVPICTTCAGFSRTFDCSHCGFGGKLLGGRLCERCTLSDRLTALLDDGTGRIRPALVPLFNLLVAMDKPSSGLAWLAMRRSQPTNASRLLQQLGLGQISLTHDAFHELQPWRTAAHLEGLLMTSGVLPTVDKYLCSFQRWLPGHLASITDPEHVKTIRLFATWRVLPRLRARAERSHITPSVRRFAAEQIKYATAFLQWLGQRNNSRAGQPARPDHLSARLNEAGIPAAAARGAAIRQQLLELPAPVVADALGYHNKTTGRLIRETGGTWSRHAAGDHTRSPTSRPPREAGDS